MARQAGSHVSQAPKEAGSGPGILRLFVVVSCVAAIGATVQGVLRAGPPAASALSTPTSSPSPASFAAVAPTITNPPATALPPTPISPTAVPPTATEPPIPPTPTPSTPHIGIVAGHWGSDQGAVCPDGLKEVDINLDVAQRVVHTLQELGYEVDLLKEYDPRLRNYWAYALVSIHADSCKKFPHATPPASGFKVARVEDSAVPELEDRLVSCLAEAYAARTGMYFHANSITYDMTRYHNFYEIDGRTPGAIIETGFMYKDRHILTQRADLVAQGIVDGIVCFLEE